MSRLATTLTLVSLALLLTAVPAYAAPDPTFDGGADPGGGIPGWFGAFFVLVLVLGVGTTVWKVMTAQRLAKQAGLDPGTATQVTLLSENGLDAAYLASSLRQAPTTSPVAGTKDASDRLAELKSLLDQGLVTQAEYDARRQAIIDSV